MVIYDRDTVDLYGAINDSERRGILIFECRQRADGNQLIACAGTIGEGYDPEPVDYLKITLFHTDETEKMALALLKGFVSDRLSLKETNDLIRGLVVC